ncbi:MAG: glycosyltransferase 87 family protein [Pseudomonadota bacterium]
MQKRDTQLALIVCLAFLVLSYPAFRSLTSPDLLAPWLAAEWFQNGQLGDVYPSQQALFDVRAPQSWQEAMAERGYDGILFPYIYPPLWAAMLAPITAMGNYPAFHSIVLAVHHLCVLGMLFLAWRTAAPAMPLTLYLLLGLLCFLLTPIGALALFQNQPQILVSFLTVLAIERARAGAGRTAGAVLALAVAIKLAPLFLLPAICAVGRVRPTLLAFVLVGGGLGLGSIALAGWPLHVEFLSLLSTISGTSLASPSSWTLTALLAQANGFDGALFVPLLPGIIEDDGWWIGPRSLALATITTTCQIAIAVLAAWQIRRGAGVLIWPATLIGLSLCAPISWSFHYLAPLAFLPALAVRWGLVRGGAVALILAAPVSFPALSAVGHLSFAPLPEQLIGTLTMIAMAAVFVAGSLGRESPLHPPARRV